MLLPMVIAVSHDERRRFAADWPTVTVVESVAKLHELLARGPYEWWRDTAA